MNHTSEDDNANKNFNTHDFKEAQENAIKEASAIINTLRPNQDTAAQENIMINNMAELITESHSDHNTTFNAIAQRIAQLYWADPEQAKIFFAEHIKAHGQLNPYIDVTLVKDLGISYGLEKVYNTFDVDHESKAKIKTYMSKVVRKCVLT